MPPDTAASIPPYLVAILIAAVGALAGVIAYLFKHYSGKQDFAQQARLHQEQEFAKERIAWAVERSALVEAQEKFETRLRLEYEIKHRDLVNSQIQMMKGLHEDSRDHEDAVRREFAELMESVATKASEAQDKTTAVIDKLYDRYVGPRSRMKG